MIEIFKVETKNIIVGKRSYSFDYRLYRNRKLVSFGNINSTHTRHRSTIVRWLTTGGMAERVLGQEI